MRLDLRSTGECISSAGSLSSPTGGDSDVFGDTAQSVSSVEVSTNTGSFVFHRLLRFLLRI